MEIRSYIFLIFTIMFIVSSPFLYLTIVKVKAERHVRTTKATLETGLGTYLLLVNCYHYFLEFWLRSSCSSHFRHITHYLLILTALATTLALTMRVHK